MNTIHSITDYSWIDRHIREVKQIGPRFATNAFFSPDKIEHWTQTGVVHGLASEGCLLLLRKDADFLRLYYYAANYEALRQALFILRSEATEDVICDLVGRQLDIDALASIFEQGGFRRYAALCRLVKTLSSQQESVVDDAEVVMARAEDVAAVSDILNTAFDRYAEQIPTLSEIAQAVQNANLLLVRRGGKIAGLLHYESVGVTGTVRYWYVDSAFRNQGLASRLLRSFFSRCPQAKRAILWVMKDNENAIVRYKHFGFIAEGLTDQIMLLPRSRQ